MGGPLSSRYRPAMVRRALVDSALTFFRGDANPGNPMSQGASPGQANRINSTVASMRVVAPAPSAGCSIAGRARFVNGSAREGTSCLALHAKNRGQQGAMTSMSNHRAMAAAR